MDIYNDRRKPARSYELRGSDKECFNVSDLSEKSSGDHAVIAGSGRARLYLALVIVSATQQGARQIKLPRRQLDRKSVV